MSLVLGAAEKTAGCLWSFFFQTVGDNENIKYYSVDSSGSNKSWGIIRPWR